jgi:DNA-binding beta-propeller fold protein YncE
MKKDTILEEPALSIKAGEYFLIVEKIISGSILETPLAEPYGLAASKDGSIYVVDRGANRVIKFNSELVAEKQIGGFGKSTETFNRPTFVTVDNNLNIFVSDENNRRVSRFDAQLNFVDELRFEDEEDPFKFGYPSGIAVTNYGETWIADRERNRLCLFNNVGNFSRFLGEFGSAEGQLQSPEKIVVSNDAKFYLCDAGRARIVIFDEFGNFVRKIEFDKIEYPISMTLENEVMWVIDGAGSKVFLTGKNGAIIKQFGPMLPGDATALKEPSDLIMLGKDRLLIADSGNRRLVLCRIERGDSH